MPRRRPGMESVQELIPLAQELVARRPGRKLVKLYVLGSVLAFLGVVIGLVGTVCGPFTAAGRRRDEEALVAELRAVQPRLQGGKPRGAVPCGRALSYRPPAS